MSRFRARLPGPRPSFVPRNHLRPNMMHAGRGMPRGMHGRTPRPMGRPFMRPRADMRPPHMHPRARMHPRHMPRPGMMRGRPIIPRKMAGRPLPHDLHPRLGVTLGHLGVIRPSRPIMLRPPLRRDFRGPAGAKADPDAIEVVIEPPAKLGPEFTVHVRPNDNIAHVKNLVSARIQDTLNINVPVMKQSICLESKGVLNYRTKIKEADIKPGTRLQIKVEDLKSIVKQSMPRHDMFMRPSNRPPNFMVRPVMHHARHSMPSRPMLSHRPGPVPRQGMNLPTMSGMNPVRPPRGSVPRQDLRPGAKQQIQQRSNSGSSIQNSKLQAPRSHTQPYKRKLDLTQQKPKRQFNLGSAVQASNSHVYPRPITSIPANNNKLSHTRNPTISHEDGTPPKRSRRLAVFESFAPTSHLPQYQQKSPFAQQPSAEQFQALLQAKQQADLRVQQLEQQVAIQQHVAVQQQHVAVQQQHVAVQQVATSQWKPPLPPSDSKAGKQSSNSKENVWVQAQMAGGYNYYYNVNTQETSWVLPPGAKLYTDPNKGANTPVGTPAKQVQWQKLYTADGREYWYERASGVTSWTKPNIVS